jgi:hypothetical protein
MKNQTLYWEVENYSGSTINLFEEGEKIFSEKLTIKQVEKHIGKKLKVCPANQHPQFIVGARVEENGTKFIDARKSLRGTTQKYYILN